MEFTNLQSIANSVTRRDMLKPAARPMERKRRRVLTMEEIVEAMADDERSDNDRNSNDVKSLMEAL
jgi:hypothetical protein